MNVEMVSVPHLKAVLTALKIAENIVIPVVMVCVAQPKHAPHVLMIAEYAPDAEIIFVIQMKRAVPALWTVDFALMFVEMVSAMLLKVAPVANLIVEHAVLHAEMVYAPIMRHVIAVPGTVGNARISAVTLSAAPLKAVQPAHRIAVVAGMYVATEYAE